MGAPRTCHFMDASALAKVFVAEAGMDCVRALHDPAAPHILAATRLAPVEVAAAVFRRARAGEIAADAAQRLATQAMDLVEARYLVADVTAAVTSRAVGLLSRYRLSPADAVHLAAAVEMKRDRTDIDVVLVSSDLALNDAARTEGVTVLDPASPAPTVPGPPPP